MYIATFRYTGKPQTMLFKKDNKGTQVAMFKKEKNESLLFRVTNNLIFETNKG